MNSSWATPHTLRWLAVIVLVLSSALNYLDRMVLMALMPTLQEVFGVSRAELGFVVSAFSIVYAFSSPVMGLLIDRIGLRWGTALIVTLWSTVGMLTGFAGTMTALLVCRAFLGFAEAGGVPATGKGFGTYLPPETRAVGGALSQVGLTIGSMGAPLLTEWLFPRFGWRSAFVVSGALGFLWLPLWFWISGRAKPIENIASIVKSISIREILSDRRFAALVVANILAMTIYSLWTNWTTLFFVTRFGLSREQANLNYAWIPPLFATAGGLLGAWLAHRAIRGGAEVIATRVRISLFASVFALSTWVASLVPTPQLAVAAICVSLTATTCLSVNYYSIPLDLFGASRAAFAVSMLTGVFGLMQALLSPLIGRWSEEWGWQPVCLAVSVLPLISALLLQWACRKS